ncbi:MAG TPA: succinate dehydrogenase, hydrophobic membrane anchor protein [Steroidobacteraceae bacterium]|nr:succinate dehydrogenase, hydrophobic membrane anchor protein [Steroidobacteraceae bacterium]
MSMRSPLGRVLGLGAAGGGSHHWWLQRLTALALVPLGVWFLVALLGLPDLGYLTVRGWLAAAPHGLLLALLVVAAAYHSWLGVCVVIEDYVPNRTRRLGALLVAQFLHLAAGAGALFAVLKLSLGSAA